MKKKTLIVALIGFFVAPVICFAGSFKVVPVRVVFNVGEKTSVVKVVNTGDDKVTIQLSVKAWGQDENGKEIYQDTNEIILFPKIASIAKDDQQIIRLGYQEKKIAAIERTYRLFIEELPVREPGDKALKFVLRMVVPIFVLPANEQADWSLSTVALNNGLLQVKIENKGNRHIAIDKLNVTGKNQDNIEVFSKQKGGGYVLADSWRYLSVEIPQAECLQAYTLGIAVGTEKTVLETELVVDRSMCESK